MRRMLCTAVVGAALLAASQSANAAVITSIIACQGVTCVSLGGLPSGTTPQTFTSTVGDYSFSVQGAYTDLVGLGQTALTTINAIRTGSTSALPLTVTVQTSNFANPIGALYDMDTSHGATESGGGAAVAVDFQGWIDFNNANPAVQWTNGMITCTPSGGGVQSCAVNGTDLLGLIGTTPYSMRAMTTFNIGQLNLASIMTSNSQIFVTARQLQVPEPATTLVLGVGLLGLAVRMRRRGQ